MEKVNQRHMREERDKAAASCFCFLPPSSFPPSFLLSSLLSLTDFLFPARLQLSFTCVIFLLSLPSSLLPSHVSYFTPYFPSFVPPCSFSVLLPFLHPIFNTSCQTCFLPSFPFTLPSARPSSFPSSSSLSVACPSSLLLPFLPYFL